MCVAPNIDHPSIHPSFDQSIHRVFLVCDKLLFLLPPLCGNLSKVPVFPARWRRLAPAREKSIVPFSSRRRARDAQSFEEVSKKNLSLSRISHRFLSLSLRLLPLLRAKRGEQSERELFCAPEREREKLRMGAYASTHDARSGTGIRQRGMTQYFQMFEFVPKPAQLNVCGEKGGLSASPRRRSRPFGCSSCSSEGRWTPTTTLR